MPGLKITYIDFSLFTAPYDGELIRAMQRKGHSVNLFSRPTRNKNENIWLKGIQIHQVLTNGERVKKNAASLGRIIKGFELISAYGKLIKFVKKEKPDAVHFQWLNVPVLDMFFLKQLKRSTRLLLTLHDLNYLHGEGSKAFQYTGLTRTLSLFDLVIVHTEDAKEKAIRMGLPPEKLRVVPHGVMPLEKLNIENSVKDKKKKTCLFFGSLRKYKGLETLLEAWKSLADEVRDEWQLKIMGSGEQSYVDSLAETQDDASVVWDIGYFSNLKLAAELDECSLVVFPYNEIDASGAFYVALSAKKPILASRVGAFEDVLQADHPEWLFEPADKLQLKQVLENEFKRQMREPPASVMYKNALSWDQIAELSKDIYCPDPRIDFEGKSSK